jgi:hypothetical protein
MVRFKYGLPASDESSQLKQHDWVKINRIDGYIIKGLILGLILTFAIAEILNLLNIIPGFNFRVYNYIYLYLFIFPVHELLHMVFFPKPKRAVIGFALKKLVFYVTTDEVFTRTRLITSILSPLVFLTILPLLYVLILEPVKVVVYISLFNLIGSGADLILISRLIKLPKNSVFQFNGQDLFIKQS